MSGYHAATRAAAVTLMTDCAADAGVKMQIYRARPVSLFPPTGFVELINESITDLTITRGQHHPSVTLTFVWGKFDKGEEADQRDAFVDAFYEWVRTRYHAVTANSLIGPSTIEDLPAYVPDWLPPGQTYYATQITLEGLGTD